MRPALTVLSSLMFTALLLAMLPACDRLGTETASDASDQPPPAPPVLWHEGETSHLVALPEDEAADMLGQAMDEARATADEARRDWEVTPATDRARWAVKWAATTSDGGVEYVWVEPDGWSPFRVEGVLVNEPVKDLECAKGLGERVSFPVEELADWVFLLTDQLAGPRRGGFTLDLLEDRYGRP